MELPPKEQLIRKEKPLDSLDGASAPAMPPIPLERFQVLEKVIRDTPITHDPYLELAQIYVSHQRFADARRVLDEAYKRFDDVEEVVFLREETQLLRSRQLAAEIQAEHEAEPTRLSQEKVDRALLEFNVLRESVSKARLARHPEQLELCIPLAAALQYLGKSQEAIATLERANTRADLRATASLQLGILYNELGKVPEALAALRRAALFRVPPPAADTKRRALKLAA
ncbi:MAG TPA: hypothetical protein DDW52_05855, partial [Planctomycetaceae bacterium]|nr:hypothetical protein [Planctomycetaceae bacterium]